jgi:hypothetical protein
VLPPPSPPSFNERHPSPHKERDRMPQWLSPITNGAEPARKGKAANLPPCEDCRQAGSVRSPWCVLRDAGQPAPQHEEGWCFPSFASRALSKGIRLLTRSEIGCHNGFRQSQMARDRRGRAKPQILPPCGDCRQAGSAPARGACFETPASRLLSMRKDGASPLLQHEDEARLGRSQICESAQRTLSAETVPKA